MPNRLTQKLELFGSLPDADRALLDEVTAQSRSVAARTDLIVEGDAPSDVHLILEGFACRYKLMPSGKPSCGTSLNGGSPRSFHAPARKRRYLKTTRRSVA